MLSSALAGLGMLVGGAGGAFLITALSRRHVRRARDENARRAEQGRTEAEQIRRLAQVAAEESRREQAEALHAQLGRERAALDEYAVELSEREKLLDSRQDQLSSVAARLDAKERELEGDERELERVTSEAETRERAQLNRLEERSGWSRHDAVARAAAERVAQAELLAHKSLRLKEAWCEQNAVIEGRRVMAAATDRWDGVGHLERIQNAIAIPDAATLKALADPQGETYRVFVELTGCELWCDEDTQTLTVRGDDPLGREISRRVLRQLANRSISTADRVRDITQHVQEEVEREVQNAARKATRVLGLGKMHPEIMHLVGRLKFRLSYSQNQWKHAIEVAQLAGMLAADLGEDEVLARRGGLLHDIGKAMTHDHEGAHAVLGAEVARRCGEAEVVANAIGSHHNDEPPATPLAHLVTAADALSGARPGARRENAASYVGRIQDIQRIAAAFPAVERVDIMHAGREVRIIVPSDERGDLNSHGPQGLSDGELHPLAQEIARTLEEEISYAGQIRVTVIRESRSVAIAR